MIILHEYKVSDDGRYLILDVEANPSLDEAYLTELHVSCTGSFADTDETVQKFDNLISVAVNEYTGEEIDWTAYPTQIRLHLPLDSAPYIFGNKMFYLQVKAIDPSHTATCAMSDTLATATYYKYPIYKKIACSAHQMEGCEPPKEFIDYLMRIKALEASIAVMNVASINEYFDWLILHGQCESAISTTPSNRGCGCHS